MTSTPHGGHHAAGLGATSRLDTWWLSPLLVVLGLGAFGIYATWAAFQASNYFAISYLSPFYSPVLFVDPSAAGAAPVAHAWIGTFPAWWPAFIPASPALLILAIPGSFRFTCYYYRKAYYRAFAASPPACAVGGIRPRKYKGETFLLLFQNLHRYALYPALAFIGILTWDALQAFVHEGEVGIGVGSVVLVINAILLGGYTLGCHSFRHLIGGQSDCFSCNAICEVRHKGWSFSSILNRRHMLFAWMSLFWVGFSDFYVRMVAMGVISDLNTWGTP